MNDLHCYSMFLIYVSLSWIEKSNTALRSDISDKQFENKISYSDS
jgi:hypothetical protein